MRAHIRAHTNPSIEKCSTMIYCSTKKGDLTDIANAVQRLTIDRRNPEKFHMDKSEIVAALRRMARAAKP